MRRKRTLPTPLPTEISEIGNVHDANGRQILRLEQDPNLQTLTPRSLAKTMAELDSLKSRVLELEQQLAKHQIEALTPSKAKLPPLADPVAGPNAELVPTVGLHLSSPSGVKSTCELKTIHCIAGVPTISDRIATAPAATSRNVVAILPLTSSAEKINEARPEKATPREGNTIAFVASSPDLVQEMAETNPIVDVESSGASVLTRERGGDSSPSAVSPLREETKITIGHEGEAATFAISQRNRLYQNLKRLSTIAMIPEDELLLLKKLVDAEIGDVIKFLLEIESEQSVAVIRDKLSILVKDGSPSKHRSLVRPALPRHHPVWSIQYPLLKIAQNLEHLQGVTDVPASSPASSPSKKIDVIVLVSSGAYNPIHMLHIRAFYVARQYVESNYKFPVVGAFISPSHDTYVRVKNRRNPREMITKRHRLALIETAVASSSWIEVDKWEITRRRVLDYLSTLTHVREMCESHFPQYRFHVMYVCGCNTVVKLSHSALRDEGFGCITVCRPTQTDMVIKHLGKTLSKTTTIVEDTGVLPCDLERATSFRVRQALANVDAHANKIEMMVGKPVFQYFMKHEIGMKIAGKVSWTEEDKQWRQEDLTYVEYTES
ncbi:putative nicotinamide-nucleotide adenylyltransferase/ nicotinate-nucleotide adenylyltransferase [Phytophthora cinnamomi]|uniref:putative nicotinamide-nucleotide adenylyltransferase/ nicotinate-nucleotide adenylyltransferase n=1 Tax=Phytophthora cinnamomi TaxID=4785 RepID=UPI00355A87EA|nr:putative nicotinamide-nucleotide adenylyltransferase/ nicotinate-nucleotide adenylyltransferase [Phytophthora cinnamomi]